MTSNRISVLRGALGLLSVRWIAAQIGLALLVFALAVAWLRVPDASAVDVAGTVLLGLVVLAAAGGGEAALLLRLARRPVTRVRVLFGGFALLLVAALWSGWSGLLSADGLTLSQWAGYLNSRFPQSLRDTFSYEHLFLWIPRFLSLLVWLVAGALAPMAAGAALSARPARAVIGTLRSVVYWIGFLVSVFVAVKVTGWLANWTPGHGLWVEAFSVVLRSCAVLAFDGVVVSLLLALLVASVLRYETPVGTPDESQPRTVANP
jgi:hypothetical protein